MQSEKTGRSERNGFTLDLGIGAGLTHVIPESGESLNKIGVAPVFIGVGWFSNNDLKA